MPEWKVFTTTFVFVFLAELADRTQLATLLFSADHPGARWFVFAGAAASLVLSAGIGVLAGAWVSYFASDRALSLFAGLGFMVLGLWTLKDALPS